jgi:hypothetical protein
MIDWTGLCSYLDVVVGCCGQSEEALGVSSSMQFRDQLRNYYLLTKDCAKWRC